MQIYKIVALIVAITSLVVLSCSEDKKDEDTSSINYDFFLINFSSEEVEEAGSKIGDILGVSVHTCWSEAEWCVDSRNFEFSKLREAGVKIVRTDFSWSEIEPTNDEFNLQAPQPLVDSAIEYGLDVIAILDYCNSWACEEGNTSSIDVEEFAEYAGALAETYKDKLNYYEVWNEENLSGRFWEPSADPFKYGELLKATYLAVKQNDPDAKVLFGGLAPIYILSMFPNPQGIWGFYYQVKYYHPDIDDYFDIFNIHPYTSSQHFAPEWEFPIQEIVSPSIPDAIRVAKEMVKKPLWITEFGWPSLYLSEDIQAAYLARGFILAAKGGVERALWYTTWDGYGNTTEDRFGLFRVDRSEKPSYLALKALYELLGEFRPYIEVSAHLKLKPWEQAYLFIDDQKEPRAIALWSVAPGQQRETTIKIPFDDGPFKIYDMTGNIIETTKEGTGEIEIEISNYPIYILW